MIIKLSHRPLYYLGERHEIINLSPQFVYILMLLDARLL